MNTSANLHSIQPTTSGTPGAGLLLHILWSTLTNMLGWVGLTPMRLVFIGGVFVIFIVFYQTWRAATGRRTWSLNERDALRSERAEG